MKASVGLGVAIVAAVAGAGFEMACSRGAVAPQGGQGGGAVAAADAGAGEREDAGAGEGGDAGEREDAGGGAASGSGTGADAGSDAGAESGGDAAAQVAVKVENIGMHIGGGPNDAETKAPIARSVEPHFPELAQCFARVDDPKKGGDFGVDLHIPKDGGRAEVGHPRTSLGPDAFRTCVVGVFERIEFRKPKTGETIVSYSLRFTPAK